MSQSYPSPWDIEVPEGTRPTPTLIRVVRRDGFITPILVRDGKAADQFQAERVVVARRFGFETILVEDEWDEDDL